MNYDLTKVALDAASFLMALAAIIYAWFANRRKDVDVRFEQGSRQMRGHEERIARLEQTVQSMPGTADVHRLEKMLLELSGDLKAMNATMKGMSDSLTRTENIVTRHEDHLRERH